MFVITDECFIIEWILIGYIMIHSHPLPQHYNIVPNKFIVHTMSLLHVNIDRRRSTYEVGCIIIVSYKSHVDIAGISYITCCLNALFWVIAQISSSILVQGSIIENENGHNQAVLKHILRLLHEIINLLISHYFLT